MIYRWIYNIWRFILISVTVIGGLVLSLLLIAVGILQLPQSKNYLKTQIENTFNEQFEGSLYIQSIEGFIPFQINFTGGQFYAAGDISHPVITFESANVDVSWWDLLQKNLTINSFELVEPAIHLARTDGELNIANIFVQAERVGTTEQNPEADDPFYENIRLIDEINLFAPRLIIVNGTMLSSDEIGIPKIAQLPSPLNIQNLNTEIFLEITEAQLFADITRFSADLPDTPYQYVRLQAQFYNDERYFEVNGFNITTAGNSLDLSFESQPVSIFRSQQPLGDQLRNAEHRLNINPSMVSNDLFRRFIPQFPDFDEEISLEANVEGTADELWVDRFQMLYGESAVILTANLQDLFGELTYDTQIENFVLMPEHVQWLSDTFLNGMDTSLYENVILRGDLYGNLQETTTDITLDTDAGSMMVDLFLNHRGNSAFEMLAELDSLNISPVFSDSLSNSMLNGRIAVSGNGIDRSSAFLGSVDLAGSSIKGHEFPRLMGEFDYGDNQLSYSLQAQDQSGTLQAAGRVDQRSQHPLYSIEGNLRNFNASLYTDYFSGENTDFNATFSANINGNDIDTAHGRVSIEMEPSIIGADTLRAHQLYADLSEPDQQPRNLRFTSSFVDGEIEGTIAPTTIKKYASYWNQYLQERVRREFLFDREFTLADLPLTDEPFEYPELELTLQLTVKDLNLLRHYLKDVPEIESRARLTASLNVTEENLLISGTLFEELFRSENIRASNVNTSINAEFNHGESIRDFGNLDLQVNSGEVNVNEMTFYDSYLNFSMRNDSLQLQQQFVRDDNIELQTSLTGALYPGRFEVTVNDLLIGSPQYNWRSGGESQFIYTDEHKLTLNQVRLTSDEDLLEINGTFSESFEDSVDFKVENLDLTRISDLIGGRISFSGILNSEFITRSLTQIPNIQGEIEVTEGRINNRLIGDVSLISELNPDENQFDTSIRVYTDPQKYPDYYARNDSTGQDLRLNGYFKIPDELDEPEDDLFYFDADLREIDLWIVSFIVPNVIERIEGKANGTGFISGNRSDFNFNSDFTVENATGVPRFTNVEYDLNGELNFNKTDGLTFQQVNLTDHRGGTARLTGTVDLNEFQPGTYLDLTLDLNDVQFMNNPFDPDIPFYGSLYGTGQAQIVGSNTSPLLRTNGSVNLSSRSQISIPLEEETEFEQDRRFIQFVDTFDLEVLAERMRRQQEEQDSNGQTPDELTFVELFTMDLQFTANDPINVRLIFDPVTNEILNANGTGQVRVLLQDQDVSMFGRFNIESGDYQFVSGDIFTRRFTLQEGGSISWQGDLIDAGLDVTAVYRARPVISTLLSSNAASASPESGQRIPIELVLQIGGTITQVENEFFFRVPTGIEGTLDPTLATQINNLNQNEEEKLIQATSILLSGNFIPSNQAQGLGLGEGFSGTAAVVNPLLSSQVINPLLSNQINSLLRSDITFDIDLNLTAFNEVDLGVALRLFDDRVILRREGQITGEQSDIGDLGATYRINRTFSLTAFHRQDPTLSYTSSIETRQTQEMNGVGLEAQFQFNTWQQFKQRILNAFRGLFGLNKRDEEESSEENSSGDALTEIDE